MAYKIPQYQLVWMLLLHFALQFHRVWFCQGLADVGKP